MRTTPPVGSSYDLYKQASQFHVFYCLFSCLAAEYLNRFLILKELVRAIIGASSGHRDISRRLVHRSLALVLFRR